jgi:hypothetical protein
MTRLERLLWWAVTLLASGVALTLGLVTGASL